MTKTRNLADLGGGFIQAGTGAVQRTVESKLQDVVSVLDFDADPTGQTDSTDAIQHAIDYIIQAGGGTVYFPRGNYLVTNTLLLDKAEYGAGEVRLGVKLIGEAYGLSRIIRQTGMPGSTIYVGGQVATGRNAPRSYIVIQDLELTCQDILTPPSSFTDAHIELCGVTYATLHNLSFADGACNLLLKGVASSHITNCTGQWSTNAVSGADRHMVVLDKTPADYTYQLLCSDLVFTSCNFRMGAPAGGSGLVAKSTIRIRCTDGVWFEGCHLQGGDYTVWFDNSELGISGSTRGISGLRFSNTWFDQIESGTGVYATASVYMTGDAKIGGNILFSGCAFTGGDSILNGFLAPSGQAINLEYGMIVDSCAFYQFRKEAIKFDSSDTSVVKNIRFTNNTFYYCQADPDPGLAYLGILGYVGDVVFSDNTITETPGCNSVLHLKTGSTVWAHNNAIDLPYIYNGDYVYAFVKDSGVVLRQFNNSEILADGAYADDAAAATGGVPVGAFYISTGNTIKQRTL